MKRFLIIIGILISLIINNSIIKSEIYYIAPYGHDTTGLGTLAQPWRTFTEASTHMVSRDTCYIRGGRYMSYRPENVQCSGTRWDSVIYFIGYPEDVLAGNRPIFDCRHRCDTITAWTLYNSGIYVFNQQYLYFKDFDVTNVFQCGDAITGAFSANNVANITYENIYIYQIGQRGFFHTSGAWGYWDSLYAVDVLGKSVENATPIFPQPDTTRWINSDSFYLCDSASISAGPGNAADGWKVVSAVGNYYYWEGCRAAYYSDDGFDPNKGERVFVDCWAMATDKYRGIDNFEANGFKTSGIRTDSDTAWYFIEDTIEQRQVKQKGCLALHCAGFGFYHGVESDTTINPYWLNNTAWDCGEGFSGFAWGLDSVGDVFRNNISYNSIGATGGGEGGYDGYDIAMYSKYEESNNTWNWIQGWPWFEQAGNVSVWDFDCVDSLTLEERFMAPRDVYGNLPSMRPLRLISRATGLIDQGTQIYASDHSGFDPISYEGSAPDIGYYEYVASDFNDTTAPGLADEFTGVGLDDQNIYLTWGRAIDSVGVHHYGLIRNGTFLDSTVWLHYQDEGLTQETQYSYSIYAVDAAGNIGDTTDLIYISTTAPLPDTIPPAAPTEFSAWVSTSNPETQINMSWQPVDADDLYRYYIYRDYEYLTYTTNIYYYDTGLSAGTEHCYFVRAVDDSLNLSVSTDTLCATTSGTAGDDITPPNAPTGLSSGTITQTSIVLNWDASTSSDANRIIIWRDATKIDSVSNSITTYTDEGLTASTEYDYYLTCVDDTGNASTATSTLTVSTYSPHVQVDSIKITTGTMLQDSISNNRSSGDIIYIDTDAITDTINVDFAGLTIKPAAGRTPTITGRLNVTANNTTIKKITLSNSGKTTLYTSGIDSLVVDSCTFVSDTAYYLHRITKLHLTHNRLDTGIVIINFPLTFPERNSIGSTIDYNSYDNDVLINGKPFSLWRDEYPNIDQNSSVSD